MTHLTKTYSIEIAAPVARVWEEITRRGSRCRPMFGTVLVTDLRPGSPLRYRSMDGRHTFVAGEIVEVAAPRLLVHTFTFPNLPDAPTLVRWELEETATGTRVTVTHTHREGETKTLRSVDGSWPTILDLFRQEIERGDIGFGAKLKLGLMGAFAFALPKSLRTEVVEEHLAKHPPRVD
jgi:uncharacterized protein YndB with AHSA1/START domain